MGLNVLTPHAFDTLGVETGDRSDAIAARAVAAGANLRRLSPQQLGIALDETTTRADIEALWAWFAPDGVELPVDRWLRQGRRAADPAAPASHQRRS